MTFNKAVEDKPPHPTVIIINHTAAPTTSSGCVIVPPEKIDWALIARHEPEFILSPLIMGKIDALDIAAMLARVEYRGKYRVVTSALPRPDVISGDVLREAPALDFGIWVVDRSDFAAQGCSIVGRRALRKLAALER